MISMSYVLKYCLTILSLFPIWVVYTSFFIYNPIKLEYYRSVPLLVKECIKWTKENVEPIIDTFSLQSLLNPKVDVPFAIYFITFTGFACYFVYWVEKRIKRDARQPHPLILHGTLIKESVTCNPNSEDFETVDPSIRTITDIRNLFSSYGDKEALYHGKEWLSYSSVLRMSEIISDIIVKHSHTNSPVGVLGDFSSIKCCAILGLSSIGRSIVFIPQDTEEIEISRILEEQQCEVLLIRHSNISKLEDALNMGYYRNLHTVIYTNEDLIEKMEVGYNSRAEETLMQEYNIDVLSLSHLICTEYTKYEVHPILESDPSLVTKPAVIIYNSRKEAIQITHQNIVAAASALVVEYELSEKDSILAEPISIASTLSLFLASMLCGARFSFTNRFLEICSAVQPTIISASNATYFTIYKEILHLQSMHPVMTVLTSPLRLLLQNTQYFKLVRENRVRTLLGDNLRLCLSFYSYRPISKAGVSLLHKMIGIPVSIIFGNTETCGVCTHSVCATARSILGYYAKPFMCNALRRSRRNTLLIRGSNIALNSRTVEMDGEKWFDSGISISIVKNLIIHKMPTTYESSMPK